MAHAASVPIRLQRALIGSFCGAGLLPAVDEMPPFHSLRLQLDMAEAYQRRGDAPLQQLRASLEQEAAAAAAAESNAVAGVPPPGPTAAAQQQQQGRHAHSVADVAALRSALGGVVWTASMRRM